MIVYPVASSTTAQSLETSAEAGNVAKSIFSTYNPHTSSFLQSHQQPTAQILYTRVEEEAFSVALEKKARVERIKQIREQERNLSKLSLQEYAQKKSQEAEQVAQEARYREYLEKQSQIEHLKQLKALEMERAGLAMR